MIAKRGAQSRAKARSQFLETFASALAGGGVADAHTRRVATVVAVGDDVIGGARLVQESVEEVVLPEWLMQPNETPVRADEEAQQRVGDALELVIITARLLGRAGVMNVAQNDKFGVD